MRPSIIAAAAALFLVLTSNARPARAADAPAEAFDVVLDPPDRVGDRYRIATSGSQEQKDVSTELGKVGRTTIGHAIEIEGVLTVTEVSKRQRMSRLSVKIERCVATADGKPVQVVKAGDVVDVSWDDGRKAYRYRVNDAEVSDQGLAILSLVLGVRKPDAPTADEYYANNVKRKVGESWKRDEDLAMKSYADGGWTVKKEDASGESTLVERTEVRGVPCLTIKTVDDVRAFVVKEPLDERSAPETGKAHVVFSSTTPIALPWKFYNTDESNEIHFDRKSKGDDGGAFHHEMTITSRVTRDMERLEPKPK